MQKSTLKKSVHRATRAVLDVFYPPRCVSCRTPGAWWCADCRGDVERLPRDPCPRCLALDTTHDVNACAGTLPFAGVVATGFYHSRTLRRLAAELKYQGVTAVGPDVDAYLRDIESRRAAPFPWSGEASLMVQSMPLAPSRERDRGFNQAAFIAARIRSAWFIKGPMIEALVRRPRAFTQAELEHRPELRAANVQNAFVAISRVRSSVVLVDDVVTTGSTAGEAARVLIAAGAPRVYLAALAVGK